MTPARLMAPITPITTITTITTKETPMGSLSENLQGVARKPSALGCRIQRVITEMEDDDRIDGDDIKALRQCVEDPSYAPAGISRVLKEFGYIVDAKNVTRHRAHGDCSNRQYSA